MIVWGVICAVVLLCFGAKALAGDTSPAKEKASPHVIAYYFHGNYRCQTCTTLERLSRQAINEKFANELKSGQLEFKSVNVDESPNQHFIADFGLYTKSLVLVEMKDGRVARHKNLGKIWTLWRDEPAFEKYVQDEVSAFMKDAGNRGKK